jgi:hypothetical protein
MKNTQSAGVTDPGYKREAPLFVAVVTGPDAASRAGGLGNTP